MLWRSCSRTPAPAEEGASIRGGGAWRAMISWRGPRNGTAAARTITGRLACTDTINTSSRGSRDKRPSKRPRSRALGRSGLFRSWSAAENLCSTFEELRTGGRPASLHSKPCRRPWLPGRAALRGGGGGRQGRAGNAGRAERRTQCRASHTYTCGRASLQSGGRPPLWEGSKCAAGTGGTTQERKGGKHKKYCCGLQQQCFWPRSRIEQPQ